MVSWFGHRSIRTQIFALVIAITLPFIATMAWFLAYDLNRARAVAQLEVQILAEHSALDIRRFLRQSETTLGHIAERPLVKGLDPQHCDPVFSDYVRLNPDFITLGLRDRQANIICSHLSHPPSVSTVAKLPWFIEGLANPSFMASAAFVGPTSGRWVTVLTRPVQDKAEQFVGILALTVDLQKLSENVLEPIPRNAAIRVFDRHFTTLLRSANAASAIGEPASAQVQEFAKGIGEGFITLTDPDGVSHLNAIVSIPGVEWQVLAGLPESAVFANYYATLRVVLGMGFAMLALVLLMAWRIGAAIVKPIAQLAGTVGQIERGNTAARAEINGPSEMKSVTQQFNHMLDARDHSERALQESEQRYQALVEWSPEAVLVHRAGKVLYANPSAFKMLGATSSKELIGKLVFDLQLVDEGQDEPLITQQLLDSASVDMTETVIRRFDGATIDIEAQSTLIVYEGESAVHTSMHDITARKRVKAELMATKDMLQATLDAIPDLLFEVGLDGEIFAYHSHRTDLLAVPPSVFLGKNFADVLPPDSAQTCLSAIREASEQGWSTGARYALQLPQGECWFEL